MNPFEFARAQEIRAETSYRECASQASDPSLKNVFTLLADAEKNHLDAIRQLERKTVGKALASLPLDQIRGFLAHLGPDRVSLRAAGSRLEVYQEARRQEEEAERFYQEQGKVATDPVSREVFLALASQEHEHHLVLDWVIDLLEHPEADLENAEFNKG